MEHGFLPLPHRWQGALQSSGVGGDSENQIAITMACLHSPLPTSHSLFPQHKRRRIFRGQTEVQVAAPHAHFGVLTSKEGRGHGLVGGA